MPAGWRDDDFDDFYNRAEFWLDSSDERIAAAEAQVERLALMSGIDLDAEMCAKPAAAAKPTSATRSRRP